jgi:hypothetical protein
MIPIHVFRPELESDEKPVVGRSSPLPSIVGVHWTCLTTLFVIAYLVADKLFCMAASFVGILFGQRRMYAAVLGGRRDRSDCATLEAAGK